MKLVDISRLVLLGKCANWSIPFLGKSIMDAKVDTIMKEKYYKLFIVQVYFSVIKPLMYNY